MCNRSEELKHDRVELAYADRLITWPCYRNDNTVESRYKHMVCRSKSHPLFERYTCRDGFEQRITMRRPKSHPLKWIISHHVSLYGTSTVLIRSEENRGRDTNLSIIVTGPEQSHCMGFCRTYKHQEISITKFWRDLAGLKQALERLPETLSM